MFSVLQFKTFNIYFSGSCSCSHKTNYSVESLYSPVKWELAPHRPNEEQESNQIIKIKTFFCIFVKLMQRLNN